MLHNILQSQFQYVQKTGLSINVIAHQFHVHSGFAYQNNINLHIDYTVALNATFPIAPVQGQCAGAGFQETGAKVGAWRLELTFHNKATRFWSKACVASRC